jgi:hypothetical protein
MLVSRFDALLTLGASILIGACSRTAGTATPPSAEFLVSGPDSTFWISTTSGHVSMRGAPLTVARVDDRFYELYAADDDRSYSNALLVGERLFRRDLLTGDSVVVFSDTTVSHVADIYARTHPDERPLAPDEETVGDPGTSATAEFDILDVFGPFVSYEYHVDMKLPYQEPWHMTRRGVLDLRTGKATSVADVVGVAQSAKIVDSGRRRFAVLRDSALHSQSELSESDQKALVALERHQFDPTGFALEAVDAKAAITFAVPGAGHGPAGNLFELDPITVDSVDWWLSLRPNLPTTDGSDADRWRTPKYSVIARYDTSGVLASLSLGDSARNREWRLGDASGPLDRIDWLDRPPISDKERAALRHAFNAAANYDENARVAIGRPGSAAHRLSRAGATPAVWRFAVARQLVCPSARALVRPNQTADAANQVRSRKPARNVRAHDARALEQHGPCVWRRHSRDNG